VDPIASVTTQSQALTQQTVGISVLRKALDITAEQGAQLVKMMAQQTGVGQQVDLQA
jgi:hypothetical protein